jgi:rhamnose utilization protein RhaD (predicted bifunctional aldolase and dehydrogenase)
MKRLQTLSHLAQEYGSNRYVRAAGGNASVKDSSTLWVTPSGSILSEMKSESFVAIDRAKLSELYDVTPPEKTSARETMVRDMLLAAMQSDFDGRPSVETPLHDSFSATYVIHTHPSMVNGMLCAKFGKKHCKKLFPDALWIDYIDPGFSLSMTVRKQIQVYAKKQGHEPSMVFMKNHGIFIAGDTASDIRGSYAHVMDVLEDTYRMAGVATDLGVHQSPDLVMIDFMIGHLQEHMGSEEVRAIRAAGAFTVVDGPLTPDHVVYARSYPLVGKPTHGALLAFQTVHGYMPRIIANETGVFAVGKSEKGATLALELAQDGALVQQMAQIFGGVEFMTDAARDFIENWEAENYRQKKST